ncbi:hypothetical protein, partial [Hyphomicrobium sp.]|uniref:hypothetical protein n=1 Tax=Hyphomicrobium sp. TaxID=82 RepID=UPI002D771ABB
MNRIRFCWRSKSAAWRRQLAKDGFSGGTKRKNAPLAQGTAARFGIGSIEVIDFFDCASRLPFREPAAMRGRI